MIHYKTDMFKTKQLIHALLKIIIILIVFMDTHRYLIYSEMIII